MSASRISIPVALVCLALIGCGRGIDEEGARSPEELGRAVVDALNSQDQEALHRLRVNRREYTETLWPAFPGSDPKLNFTPEFAWGNMNRKCIVGVEKWVRRYGGNNLTFIGIRFDRPTEPYEGFQLLRGTLLTVRSPKGDQVDLRILGSVVQRDAHYKLLSYDD